MESHAASSGSPRRAHAALRAAVLSVLTAWSLLAPSGATLAANARDRAVQNAAQSARSEVDQELDRNWSDLRAALRRGDYAAARQSLARILELRPDDPQAQLYQDMLQRREDAPSTFSQLTREQLAEIKSRLVLEEREAKRYHAERKALDKKLKREQKQWDEELKNAGAEAERTNKRRKREEGQAAKSRKELAERLAKPQTAPGPEAVPEPPKAETPSQAAAVEEEAAEEAESERVITRVRPPPGAVQINANQMSTFPDNKTAVAEGNVEVLFENAVLTCDRMTLFTDTKDVYAEGRVRLEDGNQVFRGELIQYNLETKKGRFLQGTVSTPPWHQHGRRVEHIAEGVYQVTPGYITSCDMEPPHFRFAGRKAIVYSDDRLARAQNVAMFVNQVPFLYLPWLSIADRKSPFFIVPGKRKPWGLFALMGYRYEPPAVFGVSQKGTAKVDWRNNFGWGIGLDHELESDAFGKGLLKLYYNELPDKTSPVESLPKGADGQRYRVMWRHRWQPMPDTTVVTDLQKFSDVNFRKDFLFREEFIDDDLPESFISAVTNDPNYSLSAVVRKRLNRFQTVDEALPQVTLDVRPQRIADTELFSETRVDVGNFQSKTANSDTDEDVIRADWFQQLSYAMNWFRPVLITPKAGIRQTYYTKDIQSGTTGRLEGDRNLVAGQVNFGADASLKLFRIFPVTTNLLGLDLNLLRHVLTPTISYNYIHRPTVSNDLLNFPAASTPGNRLAMGIENKLQTRRYAGKNSAGKDVWRSVDLARFLIQVPYAFHSTGNKTGGKLEDWLFDLELYPWPWMRLESDWTFEGGNFDHNRFDSRGRAWNLDMVLVGGRGEADAQHAHPVAAPAASGLRGFEPGSQVGIPLLPQGQWYLGLGHRYARNDKTEGVLEFDWRLSDKWQVGTFHRFTFKEVALTGGAKRFNFMRERQYTLSRDLHDWIGELAYRIDRDFGSELFFTLTLKAYPNLPIETSAGYNEPKPGSIPNPFLRR